MRRQKAEQQEPWPVAATSTPEVLDKLTEQVRVLAKRIGALQQQLETFCADLKDRPTVTQATIIDLNSDKQVLTSPVQITIEEYGDEVVAAWPELEAFASGKNTSEALCRLKKEIVSLYEALKTADRSALGRLPSAWLRILSRLTEPADVQAGV